MKIEKLPIQNILVVLYDKANLQVVSDMICLFPNKHITRQPHIEGLSALEIPEDVSKYDLILIHGTHAQYTQHASFKNSIEAIEALSSDKTREKVAIFTSELDAWIRVEESLGMPVLPIEGFLAKLIEYFIKQGYSLLF